MKFDYPDHWVRGELLDHQLFDKGKSRCKLLAERIEIPQFIDFDSREEAQAFISWWYAPSSVRQQERECQEAPIQSDVPPSTRRNSRTKSVRSLSKGKA